MAAITPDFYVDSAGDNSDGLTWAKAYTTIGNAIAGSVTTGSIVFVKNTHDHNYNLGTTLAFPNGSQWISANASGVYTAGAKEVCGLTGTSVDFSFNTTVDGGAMYARGLTFHTRDDFNIGGSNEGSSYTFDDCELAITGGNTSGRILMQVDGGVLNIINSVLYFTHDGHEMSVGGGATINLKNVAAHGSTTKLTNLGAVVGAGGGRFNLENVDIGSLMAVSGGFLDAVEVNDDAVSVTLSKCTLPASFVWSTATPAWPNYSFTSSECGTGSTYYGFGYEDWYGSVEQDTTQYMTSGATYDGTNEFSFVFDTSTNATALKPLRYKIGSIPSQALSTDMTVSVELSSATVGLTKNNCWLELEVQNTTNQALADVQSSQTADPLAAGAALAAGTGTWVDATGTEYLISHAIGAITGVTNSNVGVYLCVGNGAAVTVNANAPTIAAT